MGSAKVHVHSVSLEGKIRSLEALILGFEERHGCDTEQMARMVATGSAAETAEICAWLTEHSILLHLRSLRGHTTGIVSTTTS